MKHLRRLFYTLLAILIVIMATGTAVEKAQGADKAAETVYHTWWFAFLWGILLLFLTIILCKSRQKKHFWQWGSLASLYFIFAGALLHTMAKTAAIAITYAGFILLLLSFSVIFFNKKSRFRQLLKERHHAKKTMIIFLLSGCCATLTSQTLPTLPAGTAERMGDIAIEYNGRICPLQTFARDFCFQLYGHTSYRGLSAEQVLSGWLFYADAWQKEPILKKNNERLNLEGFRNSLKIYPLEDDEGGVRWYAQADALRTSEMTESEFLYIKQQLNYCQLLADEGDFGLLDTIFLKHRVFQQRHAGRVFPTDFDFQVEKLYNHIIPNRMPAGILLILGCIFLSITLLKMNTPRWITAIEWGISVLSALYLLVLFLLRWRLTHYIPLAGGYETMMFLALCTTILALSLGKRWRLALSIGISATGIIMLAAMIDGPHAPITVINPVLKSPLLLVHVAIIMAAYALLAFTFFISIAAIAVHFFHKSRLKSVQNLQQISEILLYPALFCLVAGIIIGSVWAQLAWGSYWSWDPKEVWALITAILYAIPLFFKQKKANPMFFHSYVCLAFLSVAMTYFGVNLLLGGLHAYS